MDIRWLVSEWITDDQTPVLVVIDIPIGYSFGLLLLWQHYRRWPNLWACRYN